MTLEEFLLARLAEDEEHAKFDGAHWMDCEHFVYFSEGGLPCTCGLERRLLADVEAKREIVERPHQAPGVLRILATIYADHPDYNDGWRPA